MSRLFYHVMQDNAGNLLFDVSGTMRSAGSGTLATIYGDEALTIVLPNPMTNHPSYGSFKCYVGAGNYDFYMAKSGYTFETLTGLQGWGTMAQQDASNVNITGGTAKVGTLETTGNVGLGTAPTGQRLQVNGPTTISGAVNLQSSLAVTGNAALNGAPGAMMLDVQWKRNQGPGMLLHHVDTDAGNSEALRFTNLAGTPVGSVSTTGSATAFNTTSDARLKTAVQNLVGELAAIRALRPVRFRWLADDSEGVGFIAGEVAEHVQGVITGEPDEVNSDGTIRPQMIDMSKLVPWLCGALQTLAGQVETLMERVTELEAG